MKQLSDPDLQPLMDVGNVRVSTPDRDGASVQESPAGCRARPGMHPSVFTRHPISQGEAYAICDHYVGLGRFSRLFTSMIPVSWDRLRAADTPEERLTCERMINAVNRAHGLHMHHVGARTAAKNQARVEGENVAEAAAEAVAAEAAAIARWT